MDDNLIQFIVFIALAVATAIFNWMRKRGNQEDWGDQAPPGGAPSTEKPNWEEELRRLLEGEEAPPKPPPQAPPPIRPPEVVNRPSEPQRSPQPYLRPQPVAPPAPPPLPTTYHRPLQTVIPQVQVEESSEDRGLPVRMPSLEQAAQAYLRASHLDTKVAAHLREVGQRVQTHAVPEVTSSRKDIQRAKRWLGDREALRAAVIASVILGPPKSLEE